MKRLLPIGAVIGIIFLALGVLFLLAAAAAPENWILAVFFLVVGFFFFGGSVYKIMTTPTLRKGEEDQEWLPIDDLGGELWLWLVFLPLVLIIAGVIYWMASDDWRAWLVIVPGLLLFLAMLAVNHRHLAKIIEETGAVSQIEPEFRGIIRQAFGARKVLREIVSGIKGDRHDFWTRYLDQANEIIRLVLVTGKRASDLKSSGSASFSAWKNKLREIQEALNQLTAKLATATSEIELASLERSFADVTESLKGLDDRIDAAKEVRGIPKPPADF